MLHSLDVNRYLNITSLKWLKVAMPLIETREIAGETREIARES